MLWSVTSAPPGSTATIVNPTSATTAYLIPDKAGGSYVFSVSARNASTSTTQTVTTEVFAALWMKTATGKVPVMLDTKVSAAPNIAGAPRLAVAGTKLVRADNGNEAIVTGFNHMYHEHKGSTTTIASLTSKFRANWGSNAMRVGISTRAVNLELNHPYTGSPYLTLLDQLQSIAETTGCQISFDPRWGGIEGRTTDGGSPTNQQFVGVPPTTGNDSVTAALAPLPTRYLAKTNVMFSSPGRAERDDRPGRHYRAFAQACVNAVRGTGSQAIVQAAGLDYGRDLSLYVGNPLTGGQRGGAQTARSTTCCRRGRPTSRPRSTPACAS